MSTAPACGGERRGGSVHGSHDCRPFSPGGLYVGLANWQGFGRDFVGLAAERGAGHACTCTKRGSARAQGCRHQRRGSRCHRCQHGHLGRHDFKGGLCPASPLPSSTSSSEEACDDKAEGIE